MSIINHQHGKIAWSITLITLDSLELSSPVIGAEPTPDFCTSRGTALTDNGASLNPCEIKRHSCPYNGCFVTRRSTCCFQCWPRSRGVGSMAMGSPCRPPHSLPTAPSFNSPHSFTPSASAQPNQPLVFPERSSSLPHTGPSRLQHYSDNHYDVQQKGGIHTGLDIAGENTDLSYANADSSLSYSHSYGRDVERSGRDSGYHSALSNHSRQTSARSEPRQRDSHLSYTRRQLRSPYPDLLETEEGPPSPQPDFNPTPADPTPSDLSPADPSPAAASQSSNKPPPRVRGEKGDPIFAKSSFCPLCFQYEAGKYPLGNLKRHLITNHGLSHASRWACPICEHCSVYPSWEPFLAHLEKALTCHKDIPSRTPGEFISGREWLTDPRNAGEAITRQIHRLLLTKDVMSFWMQPGWEDMRPDDSWSWQYTPEVRDARGLLMCMRFPGPKEDLQAVLKFLKLQREQMHSRPQEAPSRGYQPVQYPGPQQQSDMTSTPRLPREVAQIRGTGTEDLYSLGRGDKRRREGAGTRASSVASSLQNQPPQSRLRYF